MKEYIGKFIEFNEKISHCDDDMDNKMRGKVTSVISENDYHILVIDLSDFFEYNKTVSEPSFYDNNGNPTLKFHETKFYPKDHIVRVYVDNDECFSIIHFDQTNKLISTIQELIKDGHINENFCSTFATNKISEFINENVSINS